jgi:hypothetical protein
VRRPGEKPRGRVIVQSTDSSADPNRKDYRIVGEYPADVEDESHQVMHEVLGYAEFDFPKKLPPDDEHAGWWCSLGFTRV